MSANMDYIYSDIDDFFSKIIEIRTIFYLTHLKQPNLRYSEHVALEDAYNDMLPIVDSMIEGYTGIYRPPNIQISELTSNSKIQNLAEKFYKFLTENRDVFGQDEWLKSQVDDLIKIVAILIYKLKYAK